MADEPEATPRAGGGFSLSKKYGPLPAWGWGLLGGAAVYAAWRLYQARSGAASSTAATTNDTSQQVDYAPQIATLQAEIQQLQGEGSTTTPTTSTAPTTVPPTTNPTTTSTPTTNAKTMPNVVGTRANFAIGELKSGYGIIATTVPVRNPKNEYTVTGQTPKAGAKVVKGAPAVLKVKVSKKG